MLGVFSGVMHRLLGRQADLLRRVRGLRLLFLAAFGSGLGTWLAFVALTVDVWDRTHSGSWVAALLIADFLPAIALGLTVGPLIDRFSRRRVMVVADVVRFGVFLVLPFAGSAGQIVALAAVVGCATGFFRPAVYAGLPNLVKDEELPSAQGLLQAADVLTTVLGPLAGGILVAATSPDWAYVINAVTFLYSAALILRIPPHLLQVAQDATQGHWRDVAEGLKLIRGSRALLTVLVAWNVGMLGNAGVNVAEIALAKVSFDAGDFGYGLMLASAGFGLVFGSLSVGTWIEHREIAGVYGAGFALMAIGIGAAAVAPNVWIAAACVVLSGVGNGIAIVCNALLVQRGAPDRLRGRVFTVLMSSNYLVLGLGMLAAGPLTDEFGARWVWGVSACLSALAALVGYAMARESATCAWWRPNESLTLPEMAKRRDWTSESLAAGVREGDRRALARAITLVENGDPMAYDLVREVYPETGSAYVVGVTGPPGVGKSSLIAALVRQIREAGSTVGVVSVDPSSPFTKGALLGDRIRLSEHFLDPGVFIRSMGTRGHLGGLAEATLQAVLVLDAAGKDIVFVETVGTGQSEVEVIGIADTVLLVLMPGSGDSIQALKAGIMEIPDVIAINKKDHPAAKTMLNEVRSILTLDTERAWKPPIVLTEAVNDEGVADLWAKVEAHRAHLDEEGLLDERRRRNLAREVFAVASARAKAHLERAVEGDPELRRLLDEVQKRELDPLTAVREIMDKVFKLGDGDSTHTR